MLQSLENFYLAILRVGVILVAGALLAAAVALAVSSVQSLREPEPTDRPKAKPVDPDAVKRQVLGKDATPQPAQAPTASLPAVSDAERADYARAAAAIAKFVSAQSAGTESVDVGQVGRIVRDRAARYQPPHAAAYARDYAGAMERLLQDPAIAEAAKEGGAIDMVNRLTQSFVERFNSAIEAAQAEQEQRRAEHLAAKAKAEQQLYVAAGTLGGFFLIVFLSIAIRIERNLRHLGALSNSGAKPVRD